jgi:hypothetical protein
MLGLFERLLSSIESKSLLAMRTPREGSHCANGDHRRVTRKPRDRRTIGAWTKR